MKFITFLLIVTTSLWARDNRIDKCGQYEIEGKLTLENKQYRFFANHKSESEVNIALGRKIPDADKKYVGKRVQAKIELIKECRYACIGKMIEVIKRIPYDRESRMFLPTKRLIKKTKCLIK